MPLENIQLATKFGIIKFDLDKVEVVSLKVLIPINWLINPRIFM